MRRWASVLIRGVVQETPAPRRPACPARESGTAVPDKRTKAVPGDEPRDHSPRSITYMEPSRDLRGRVAATTMDIRFLFYPLLSLCYILRWLFVRLSKLCSTQENSKIVIRAFYSPLPSSFVCSARVVRQPRII